MAFLSTVSSQVDLSALVLSSSKRWVCLGIRRDLPALIALLSLRQTNKAHAALASSCHAIVLKCHRETMARHHPRIIPPAAEIQYFNSHFSYWWPKFTACAIQYLVCGQPTINCYLSMSDGRVSCKSMTNCLLAVNTVQLEFSPSNLLFIAVKDSNNNKVVL